VQHSTGAPAQDTLDLSGEKTMNDILTDLTCNRCGETFRRKPAQKPEPQCPNCGSADLVAEKKSPQPGSSLPEY
jgi:DNA-directed RNA polymerase subunit RPC12/RpoP